MSANVAGVVVAGVVSVPARSVVDESEVKESEVEEPEVEESESRGVSTSSARRANSRSTFRLITKDAPSTDES